MKGLNNTIKLRLTSTAIGIALILVAIGIITNHYLSETFDYYTILNKVDQVNSNELKLRKTEKNFLLKETINPEFYTKQETDHMDAFNENIEGIQTNLKDLEKSKIAQKLALENKINDIRKDFRDYRENFKKLIELTLEKGFKDWGLVGDMRDQIHNVENIVEDHDRVLLSKYMLSLRRREKDYLLRKDLKYRQKFNNLIEEFKYELKKGRASDFRKREELIKALDTYQSLFMKVISKDIQIGFTENKAVKTKKGLSNSSSVLDEINHNVREIEKKLASIHEIIYKQSKKEIDQAVMTLFIILGSLSLVILVILLRDSRYIVTSIKKLRNYISRLGKGELPQKIKVAGKDEISDMKHSINNLTQNLRNTRDFANEVGNGNFESEVNVFENKGELGGSLIEMRKKLLQVSQEQEKQQREAEQRIWINEGISKFSEILKQRDIDINEIAFQVISTLVKYLEANQGGIYLKNEEESEETVFDMVAAFAYNRRKFVNKQIWLNEGMVGTCAMEGETMFMTDVPKEYIQITSGLGKATPRCLILVPMKREEEVLGVIEIASFQKLEQYQVHFVERIAENVASTLYSIRMNQRTEALLERTQQQAEEMKSQEEELRQNMEELTATQERMASREKELEESLELKEEELQNAMKKASQNEKELKENTALLESMLEGLKKALVLAQFSTSGHLITSNQIYKKLFLSESDEEVHTFWDTIHQQEKAHFKNKWKQIVKGEVFRGTIRNETSEGNFCYMKTAFIPLTNEEGEIFRILYLSQVITNQEEADIQRKTFMQSSNESLIHKM
jgi:PAS domain-containing protein/HAMP domain-containing protein